MNIVDNRIHRIINLLIITNVNGIVMIEQQKKFLTELIMIGGNCKNMVVLIVEYQPPILNKWQLFHLVNEYTYRVKSNCFIWYFFEGRYQQYASTEVTETYSMKR